ncbi:endonuclease domain-containing protein [Mesorhizobium atlanticum]
MSISHVRHYRLIIEVDGSQHGDAEHSRRDQERTAYLAASGGWTILRFWNDDVIRDIGRCLPAHRHRGRPGRCARATKGRSSFYDRPPGHHRFRFRRLEGFLRQGDGAFRCFAALYGA